MYSTQSRLGLANLPWRRAAYTFRISSTSLLSMGQLCDAGCRVTFDAQSVHVHLNNQPLLTGSRDHTTGLWHLGLTADTSDTVPPVISDTTPSPGEPPLLLQHSYAATHSATPAELVAFAHAALFSPALSTLTKALDRGYLPQCMGLTSQALRKHPPHSVATIKGHLDQTRKIKGPLKQPHLYRLSHLPMLNSATRPTPFLSATPTTLARITVTQP
ncbi:hypothetical protein MHU86_17843 [Fragilaria crotonensis]|nr:hypothetical protein MHU86_17843 [Fragilaria crotonensis]